MLESELLYNDLNKVYSYNKLLFLYENYFKKLENFITNKYYVFNEIRDTKTDKNTKDYLFKILNVFYTDKTLFKKFLDMLSLRNQEIFNIIVNSGQDVHVNDLINKTGQSIILKPTGNKDDSTIYNLFVISGQFLSLPESIKNVLRNYFYNTNNSKLIPVTLPPNIIIYESKNHLSDLKQAILYIQNFNLNVGNNDRILKSDLIKINKALNLKEYFNFPSGFEYIKSENLLNFLIRLDINIIDSGDIKEVVKTLFNLYSETNSKFYSYRLLTHLNFTKSFINMPKDNIKNDNFNNTITKVLKELPVNKWISVENIIDYIFINKLFIKIITEFTAKDFYFIYPDNSSKDKIYIRNSELYNDAILLPAIKGSFYLLASLGFIDLAYQVPDKIYISQYDSLKYIRLTDLGFSILNNTNLQKHKTVKPLVKEDVSIIVNKTMLVIMLSRDDVFKTKLLLKYANQIDKKLFKVTYSSFLKDCTSKKQIIDKINLFKIEVSDNLPLIWQNFFNKLIDNINLTFEKQQNYVFYKLPENQEIIDLICNDTILKENIIKMEYFQIAISIDNLNKVKDRLKDFGFIL